MGDLARAIQLAVNAHCDQTVKPVKEHKETPYILHPIRVMLKMQSETERIVAILHDVVEDTDVTLGRLRAEGFPEEVVEAVDCLSKRQGEGYEAFIARAAGNPLARTVKIADLEDNMDIRRLRAVAPKDEERLRKYHKAWLDLTGRARGQHP